jgi:hypothetical protein
VARNKYVDVQRLLAALDHKPFFQYNPNSSHDNVKARAAEVAGAARELVGGGSNLIGGGGGGHKQ